MAKLPILIALAAFAVVGLNALRTSPHPPAGMGRSGPLTRPKSPPSEEVTPPVSELESDQPTHDRIIEASPESDRAAPEREAEGTTVPEDETIPNISAEHKTSTEKAQEAAAVADSEIDVIHHPEHNEPSTNATNEEVAPLEEDKSIKHADNSRAARHRAEEQEEVHHDEEIPREFPEVHHGEEETHQDEGEHHENTSTPMEKEVTHTDNASTPMEKEENGENETLPPPARLRDQLRDGEVKSPHGAVHDEPMAEEEPITSPTTTHDQEETPVEHPAESETQTSHMVAQNSVEPEHEPVEEQSVKAKKH